jgi:hypothetical protein
MLGWFLDYDMWCNIKFPHEIFIEIFQKLIFRYVGQDRYLPTYLPTHLI